jgi:hypothetical protein
MFYLHKNNPERLSCHYIKICNSIKPNHRLFPKGFHNSIEDSYVTGSRNQIGDPNSPTSSPSHATEKFIGSFFFLSQPLPTSHGRKVAREPWSLNAKLV